MVEANSLIDVCCSYINKPNIFNGMKILYFFVLLATVLFSYATDIYINFHNHATTFTRKIENADNFFMPPVLICMENGMKPTVMKKYGMGTLFEIPGSDTINKPLSVWDRFFEASYIINRDFIIGIKNFNHNRYDFNLTTGYNVLDFKLTIDVREYHTYSLGTCYQIESNYSVPPPKSIPLTLQFDESLNQEDIPPVRIFKVEI